MSTRKHGGEIQDVRRELLRMRTIVLTAISPATLNSKISQQTVHLIMSETAVENNRLSDHTNRDPRDRLK